MIPIKRGKEIEAMRRSCRLVTEIIEKIQAILAPGITTAEVDQYAAHLIQSYGAKSAFLGYRGFPGNICISINEEVVHGIGGKRKIRYGDLVKLDVGIIFEGWIGDTAKTFPVGTVDVEDLRLMEVTSTALMIGIAQAREGNRVGDISSAIEKYVLEQGFQVVKDFVGHGVGRRLHEEPPVPNFGKAGCGPKLKAGMILAIEPMVNRGTGRVVMLPDGWTAVTEDGQRSAHFEHTVLITKKGPEILTLSEKDIELDCYTR
ncbi:type I methionyl aminopeptidase [Candidatus Methylacidiphilum infernorum]|uniref:Methionine aminopeptidase n=1 Tax=Candidatus Methylacidiphilum infernorum TaxID=511746 RepID=A0ABX7PVM8_9BACT|nr:type I methionyl aminopeptidase [Candidatus Methylacidiphilum infernorum]QSR87065.1 type I methionyl aminopeptidase [Candidatus Methylacidiphilum infernorum]